MFQAGTAKFDRKTETFQMFQLPPHLLKDDSQQAMVGPQNWTVDNRIWLQDPVAPRHLPDEHDHRPHRTVRAVRKTARLALQHLLRPAEQRLVPRFRRENIGRIDAATARSRSIRRRRRGRGRGAAGSTTWAGSGLRSLPANASGCSTPSPKRFKEWQVPGPFFAPYDVTHDSSAISGPAE